MKEKRNDKRILFIILFIIALIVAGVVVYVLAIKPKVLPEEDMELVTDHIVRDAEVNYRAEEETKQALAFLEDSSLEPAKVIYEKKMDEDATEALKDLDEDEKKAAKAKNTRVAIAFQGATDDTTNQQVLDLLEKYDVKATFFVDGMSAAEDTDYVQTVINEGHILGDNALEGNPYLETWSEEEIVNNLARSRKILNMTTDINPTVALFNSTFYTKGVCLAAAASGYDKVLSPNPAHILNYTSFKEYEKCEQYMDKLSGDVVLVFKMAGPLDFIETEPIVTPDKPAKDMQPTTKAEADEPATQENILKVLEWSLQALKKEGYNIISVNDLKELTAEEYIKNCLEENAGVEARVFEAVDTRMPQIALTFSGVPKDDEDLQTLVDLLNEYEAGATFFVNRSEATDYAEVCKKLSEEGFCLGNSGECENQGSASVIDLYEELNLTHRQLLTGAKFRTSVYMPKNKVVNDNLMQAAGVMGYSIVNPKNYSGQPGEILRIDLGDEIDFENIKKQLDKAKNNELNILDAASFIKTCMEEPEIPEETLKALRDENEGKLATEITEVRTTDRGVGLLFYGVSNKPVVKDIVNKIVIENYGYTGTFFVTLDEMKHCEETIRFLIENGQEIGIAYTKSDKYPDDFNGVASYILGAQSLLEWRYGVTTNLVKIPFGEVNDETKEAISATGCSLIGHSLSMIRSDYEDVENADFFYDSSFSSKISLYRGELIYFNINYLSADKALDSEYEGDTIGGLLLQKLIWNKLSTIAYTDLEGKVEYDSRYKAKSYGDLVAAPGYYRLNGGQGSITMDRNVLSNMADESEKQNYIASHYIGSIDTDGAAVLPGFTPAEINGLDMTGRFTNDPVLFLTFDDWGPDSTINPLLFVLNKHGVKATFFVKTQYVRGNPNLLRAIAVEGHQIASHTDTHMALANYVEAHEEENGEVTSAYYTSLDEAQGLGLRQDLVNSYNVLHKYTGDVVVNGKKSLSMMFRPPTLAVSKVGLYQVFDVGFTYSISGDFSTHDYQAGSVDALTATLQNGVSRWDGPYTIKNGSVIVMHMSENAAYTAQTLDRMIPIWKSQGYSFARIDDYLK